MDIREFYEELKDDLETNKDGCFVITPSNDKEDLDDQYDKFNAQNDDQKEKADTISMALYGRTNYDHYYILLSKIKKGTEVDFDYLGEDYDMINFPKEFGSNSDAELKEKIQSAMSFNNNTVGRVIIYPTIDSNELESLFMRYMALDTDNKASSDNKAYEIFGKTNREIYTFIKDNIIKPKDSETHGTYVSHDETIEPSTEKPSIFSNDLPLLTPDEFFEKIDENYSCFTDAEAKSIKSWRESYALLGNGIKEAEYNKKNLERINILRTAIYKNNTDAIIQCGWLPGVEFNAENRIKASNIVKEKMINETVVDYEVLEESLIEDAKKSKKAISLILCSGSSLVSNIIKKVQNTEITHVGISLDDDIKRIYSFNMHSSNGAFGTGLSYESISQYIKDGVTKCTIYTFLVSNKVYKKIENTLENFNRYSNKTSYSLINLVTIILNIPLELDNSMVCSEFVDRLLKIGNINITNKNSSLVSPKDFEIVKNHTGKIVKIFDDNPNKFKASSIKRRIEKLKKSNLPIYEFVEYDEIVTEAKSLPIQFDSDGNLLIQNIKKIDFEQEYSNSHRLLIEYDKSNSYEPMKFELAKMQFLITLLEKKIYKQGKDKSVNELKVRARFLNDFKKYLKILTDNDKSFNFTEYFENSKFNDALIQIDKNTLKFGWKAIKYMIKG